MSAPAIILVRPQMDENIGAAARAMMNCGLGDLRLVAPRTGKPGARAYAMASGANAPLDNARLFESVEAAVGDLVHVYATTARDREMLKPVLTPREAAARLRGHVAAGEASGVLFGPERTGLESEEVVWAQRIVTVPLNPKFSSLNLAQAVLLVGYEWWLAADATPPERMEGGRTRPATREEMAGLFHHLAAELDAAGYFANIAEKRDGMLRNIFNGLQRGPLLDQDVRTLRGAIKALAAGRPRRKRRKRGQIGEPDAGPHPNPPPPAAGEGDAG